MPDAAPGEGAVIDANQQPRRRSTLPKDEARQRYVKAGELVALEQIRADAADLDMRGIAVGPFARLDAGAVAARDGKTRGAITNLFGSQAAFQAETMSLALSVADWIDQIEYPAPAGYRSAEAWLNDLLAGESARGPQHGAEPTGSYGFLWALWLSTVPYGIWSERVSAPSMAEHQQWVIKLERTLREAVRHFGLSLRRGTSAKDLAAALASLVEGVWLNQCLTGRHPGRPSEPIAAALRRSGLLLWRGAVTGESAVRPVRRRRSGPPR